jgi:outer membrane cobalamin receptor
MKMKWQLLRKMQLAFGTVRRVLTSSEVRSIWLGAIGKIAFCSLLLAGLCDQNPASTLQNDLKSDEPLKQLSLEQLGRIEVTTASKEPVEATRTSAAIYVITQEDIRRSGATSIPEVLRLVPGVEVARIDSSKWSIGVRGFGSANSRFQ